MTNTCRDWLYRIRRWHSLAWRLHLCEQTWIQYKGQTNIVFPGGTHNSVHYCLLLHPAAYRRSAGSITVRCLEFLSTKAVSWFPDMWQNIAIFVNTVHPHGANNTTVLPDTELMLPAKAALNAACRRRGLLKAAAARPTAAYALVNLVTALVPSDTACLASSPGRISLTAVWISREVTVGFLLYRARVAVSACHNNSSVCCCYTERRRLFDC